MSQNQVLELVKNSISSIFTKEDVLQLINSIKTESKVKIITSNRFYSALIIHHAWNRYKYDTKHIEFLVNTHEDAREKAIETFKKEYPELELQEVHNLTQYY